MEQLAEIRTINLISHIIVKIIDFFNFQTSCDLFLYSALIMGHSDENGIPKINIRLYTSPLYRKNGFTWKNERPIKIPPDRDPLFPGADRDYPIGKGPNREKQD